MPPIMRPPRRAPGYLTEDISAALDAAPPVGSFHAFIATYPSDGTPPGDLADELRADFAAGCLDAADLTPDGIAAHLAEQHNIAPWVPGALARLEKLYQAAHPAPATVSAPAV